MFDRSSVMNGFIILWHHIQVEESSNGSMDVRISSLRSLLPLIYEYVSCHMEMVLTNLCYKYYIILYFLLALLYGAQYYHILQREKHNNQSKFNLDTQFEKYEVSFKLY